jgi:ABC-2 type transport system permease protein
MNSTPHSTLQISRASSSIMRLGWIFKDAWVITCRDLNHWRLQPGAVMMSWAFPVMVAVMFGLFFGGAIKMPEGGSYFEFLMPGMFTMSMLFGLDTTIIAVTTDVSKGVTDRFRSLPMSGSAVVLGRCIADMFNSIVGLAIMIVAGFLLGWRWHGAIQTALAAVGLLLLLRFALLWVGIFIGLSAKGPETISSVQILEWPVGFLSNVFVDPSTMPSWLSAIAQWNPLSATASATRRLFMNPGWQGGSGVSENSLLIAVVWSALLIVIFLPLSVNKYRRLNR